ncbi:MAG: TIGR00730 family Rossman fold protein [Rhizobiaceae bacterium]|nr:TIGR00730 family Rossman fold protein [Rhizobiaceae bacterium]
MATIRSVCVYCGSSPGRSDIYVRAGEALGRSIAAHGLRLVFGGGTKGIMGAVARGALTSGGAVTGIIPTFLVNREGSGVTPDLYDELIVTADMHERKHAMFDKSDAFVALPGGIGTVEEIVEVMTWAQLGRHGKPMVFANIGRFWDPMLALIEHMKAEGFLHSQHLVQPLIVNNAEAIVPAIIAAAEARDVPVAGDESVIGKL